MANDLPLRVLLVAEGSGGHLIPAVEVAGALARRGAFTKIWYAQRPHLAGFAAALTHRMRRESVEVDPIPLAASRNPLERLWQCGRLWGRAQRCFETFAPDVVVGFGGWMSVPVLIAARLRRGLPPLSWRLRQIRPQGIRCLIHEQNVVLGRANRWLASWVDRVAISFPETQERLNGSSAVVTGMPIREDIGRASRAQAAERFGFVPDRPTLLILGGSQGARAMNQLMLRVPALLSEEERATWQVIHLTGMADEAAVKQAYAVQGVQAWVAPFLVEMALAYAHADLAVARAGASTLAELARCGLPAILLPYPHASGHQRMNARLATTVGGGLLLEESQASPERFLVAVRRILTDHRLRGMMGWQMRQLDCAAAAERLAEAIAAVARGEEPTPRAGELTAHATGTPDAQEAVSVCAGTEAR
ncbi:MAG: UDP-N-acetylglucosamine--N-acetylmuramyl-(pentapeptide) pyrophosphoryl-undecaprenol N-acetylglucosamine transferase [Candidatus Omnitrophica bacterium]|nr:UDP-N-acetylglucosamine--N-acetylmuramyl-(pentapeptide) pyrophosphoryl-undecaprenol N-acetylglucosamine transferase [Candidatus Omnitrophota bacterium]